MKNIKFTDRSIQSLKADTSRYIKWKDNGDGLGIRVSPKGKKSFIYMYRFDGKSRMMTLGDYPKMSLVEANIAHSKALELKSLGIDPAEKHIIAARQEREAETIEELVAEYIEKWAKPRKRSWYKDQLILNKDVLPHWEKRKAKDITRKDVVALLDRIVSRGAEIQANRTLAIIRKMFNFAISRDLVEISPCSGIKAPAAERKRERVLSEQEIVNLWVKIPQSNMHISTQIATKLLLVCGQRAGEVISMEWKELDLDGKWWTIPSHKAKNNLAHRVPLSNLAISLLEQASLYAGQSNYVFPSPRTDNHINVDAMSQAFKRSAELFAFEEKVIPHDLRRTAASHMTGMGINRLVVKKILNHVESDITAVYDRHSYDNEKRKALEAWGDKLTEIIIHREK